MKKPSASVLSVALLSLLLSSPCVSFAGDLKPRVVNGDPVAAGAYPFIVGIQRQGVDSKGNPYGHWCGGSLLSATKVLTAAHCFAERETDGSLTVEDPALFTVTAGITNYADASAQKRNIQSISVAQNYNTGAADSNDVAVLTLDSPVVGLPAVVLADQSYDDDTGDRAIVAGWGATFYGSPVVPSKMQQGKVQIVSDRRCIRSFVGKGLKIDPAVQICATARPVDTCQGDSGGPLFRGVNGQFVQLGIVSWGIGCAGDTPGVYTRVSNSGIRQFIIENLN